MKKQIKKLIDNNNSILILTHIRPDGDAVGSVLSLYNYLLTLNKDVDTIIIGTPDVFNFLPGYDNIKDTTNKKLLWIVLQKIGLVKMKIYYPNVNILL